MPERPDKPIGGHLVARSRVFFVRPHLRATILCRGQDGVLCLHAYSAVRAPPLGRRPSRRACRCRRPSEKLAFAPCVSLQMPLLAVVQPRCIASAAVPATEPQAAAFKLLTSDLSDEMPEHSVEPLGLEDHEDPSYFKREVKRETLQGSIRKQFEDGISGSREKTWSSREEGILCSTHYRGLGKGPTQKDPKWSDTKRPGCLFFLIPCWWWSQWKPSYAMGSSVMQKQHASGSSHVGSESANNSMGVDARNGEDLGGTNIGNNIHSNQQSDDALCDGAA